jgi:general secretion pathway protein I
MANGRRAYQTGFTLIEVMVAFSILALTVGVVSLIFSNGLRLAGQGERQTRAIALAESKMAEFSLPERLQPGELQGLAGDLRWQTRVLPWFLDPAAAAAGGGFTKPDYWRISVLAAWGDGGPGQTVALESIRLAPRDRRLASGLSEETPEDNGETGDEQ